MMETQSSQIRSSRYQNDIGQHISNSPSTTKQEQETEAQHGMRLLEGTEFESTIMKAENYTEIDGYPVENIVKTEFVEFENNSSISPHDMMTMIAVTLEKIPKTETKIKNEPSSYYDEEDPYNNVKYSESDSNLDPEPDPFADIDRGPCFFQKPPPQSDIPIRISSISATQVKPINTIKAVANASSSNPSPSRKPLKNYRELKRLRDSLQCKLCLKAHQSQSNLKSHLEICEASHRNRRRFCELCNKLFSFPPGYRRHALKFHGIKNAKLCVNSFKSIGPFRDVDCGPCFPQKPQPQSDIPIRISSISATQVKPINTIKAVANASSSNPSPSQKPLKNYRELKRLRDSLQCKLCLKAQQSQSNLKSHLEVCEASHRNRRRFCEVCNKLFSTPSGFRKHAIKIHGIKDAKLCFNSFKCQFCPRSFKFKESILSHAASHPDGKLSSPAKKERPFKC